MLDALRHNQSAQKKLISFCIFLFVLLLYSPTLKYAFVWDDITFVVKNEAITEWKNLPSYFWDSKTFSFSSDEYFVTDSIRPLRNVFFLFQYKLFALQPAGWHFVNILFHALNTVFVFRFLNRFFAWGRCDDEERGSLFPALFFSLWWGMHPDLTEVTAWVKSQDDIFSTLFGLGSIYYFLKYRESAIFTRYGVFSFVFLLAALLTKESMVAVPLISLALLWGLSRTNARFSVNKKIIIVGAGQLALVFAFLIYRHIVVGQTSQSGYMGGSFSACQAAMMSAWVRYLQLIAWPFPPTVFIADYENYPFGESWAQAKVISSFFFLTALLIGTAVLAWKTRSYLVIAGVLWFLIAMIPVSNMVPMMQIMAERFLYFPMIGFCFAGLAVYYRTRYAMPINSRTLTLLGSLVLAVLISVTSGRMSVWKNELELMKDTTEKNPHATRPAFNYAMQLFDEGETTASYRLLNESMNGLNISVNQLAFYMKVSYQYNKNTDEIRRILTEAIKTTPSKTIYREYAMLMLIDKNYPEAEKYFQRALSVSSKPAAFQYVDLANIHKIMGNRDKALFYADEALKLDPDEDYAIKIRDELKQK